MTGRIHQYHPTRPVPQEAAGPVRHDWLEAAVPDLRHDWHGWLNTEVPDLRLPAYHQVGAPLSFLGQAPSAAYSADGAASDGSAGQDPGNFAALLSMLGPHGGRAR